MDAERARELLDIQIDNAARILDSCFGVNWAEATFFDTVKLLKKEVGLKEYFLEHVSSTFRLLGPSLESGRSVPIELIEVVAHELRWHELFELANARLHLLYGSDPTLAVGDVACRVKAAFEDSWEDRVFYERYN